MPDPVRNHELSSNLNSSKLNSDFTESDAGNIKVDAKQSDLAAHGALFDLRDGCLVLATAVEALKNYSITIVEGDVLVDFDSGNRGPKINDL